MGKGSRFNQWMEQTFLPYPLDGVHDRPVIEICGIAVVNLSPGDISLDDMVGLLPVVLKIQFGKSIGRAFRRCLLQDEMHSMSFAKPIRQELHMGDHLQSELECFLGFAHLFAGMDLNQLVQPNHSDEVAGPVHSQVGRSIPFHSQKSQGTALAVGKEFLNKGPLLQVGPNSHIHAFLNLFEEGPVIPLG